MWVVVVVANFLHMCLLPLWAEGTVVDIIDVDNICVKLEILHNQTNKSKRKYSCVDQSS